MQYAVQSQSMVDLRVRVRVKCNKTYNGNPWWTEHGIPELVEVEVLVLVVVVVVVVVIKVVVLLETVVFATGVVVVDVESKVTQLSQPSLSSYSSVIWFKMSTIAVHCRRMCACACM
jgi:hypothetical protein